VIVTFTAAFGTTLSLDLRSQFGQTVELQSFHFITSPLEFRLIRNDLALQEWQAGNTEMYDLQHPPLVAEWTRDGHSFTNDLCHRKDVMTCGVLSQHLRMETRGLASTFVLMVWIRESTVRSQGPDLIAL